MPPLPDRDRIDAALSTLLAEELDRQKERLATLLGDPPDARKVPVTYWNQLAVSVYGTIFHDLEQSYKSAAAQQIDLLSEAVDQQSLAANAMQWANQHVGEVVTGFVARSKQMLSEKLEQLYQKEEDDRKRLIAYLLLEDPNRSGRSTTGLLTIRRELKPVESEEVNSTLAQGRRELMEKYLDDLFGEIRAGSVAVTTTTAATTAGERRVVEEYYRKNALRLIATWHVEDGDACQVCLDLDGKDEDEWPPEAANGPGIHRWCRCYLTWAPRLVRMYSKRHRLILVPPGHVQSWKSRHPQVA